jgi:hypothetical protein
MRKFTADVAGPVMERGRAGTVPVYVRVSGPFVTESDVLARMVPE